MKRVITLAGVVATGIMLASSAFFPFARASELDEKQNELQEVQQRMSQQANAVEKLQTQVDSVSNQLRAIDVNLDMAQREMKTAETEVVQAEKMVAETTELLNQVEGNLSKRNTMFNKRVRDIYENGQISYLEVLMGAKDFSDFSSRLVLLKRVLVSDLSLIQKIKNERELVVQKKAELEQYRERVVEMKKQAEAKRNAVVVARRERVAFLANLESQRDLAERAYQELQATSNEIERMIRRIQNRGKQGTGSTQASGRFAWPTSGEITSPFGWRVHPTLGGQRFHSGIDIGADYGDPITASDSGVVITADALGGYGNAVIIDHGNGFSTLYAHSSELLVSEGQVVRKGQVIARVGSTGYSTGPHLHFEIRQDGSPVNPLSYL